MGGGWTVVYAAQWGGTNTSLAAIVAKANLPPKPDFQVRASAAQRVQAAGR